MASDGRGIQALFEHLRDAILLDRPIPADVAARLQALKPGDAGAYWGANRTIYQVLRAAPGKRHRLREIYALGRAQGPSGACCELAAYLQFYRAFDREAKAAGFEGMGPVELAAEQPRLLRMLDEAEALFPAAGAHLINRAKVASLTDRAAAAACLDEARRASPLLWSEFRWDQGMNTYLSAEAVEAEPPAYDAEAWLGALRTGLEERAARFRRPRANLVWSMNPRFLKAHGPQWFELAPAIMGNHDLGMIVLVAGEPGEVEPLVEEARDLIARTARFRGVSCPDDVARSVVFARLPVPAWVAEPVTFFACARYLHVRQVLEATQTPAVVVDADLSPKQSFVPMLEFGARGDVAFPFSRSHSALSPWRRYIAMTGYFNATEGAARYLREVERYLLHGFGLRSSWMLDQNALDYAAERTRGETSLQNLNRTTRPGWQDSIRKANEHPA